MARRKWGWGVGGMFLFDSLFFLLVDKHTTHIPAISLTCMQKQCSRATAKVKTNLKKKKKMTKHT